MANDEQSRNLKVTDRRIFTSEGELRSDLDGGEAAIGAGAGDPSQGAGVRAPVDEGEARPESAPRREDVADGPAPAEIPADAEPELSGPLPKPSFLNLLSILAEPIPLFLGDMPLPDGRSAENLELARFHIDVLEILREKTSPNLTQEESAVLDDLLYRLRMRYVQKNE